MSSWNVLIHKLLKELLMQVEAIWLWSRTEALLLVCMMLLLRSTVMENLRLTIVAVFVVLVSSQNVA